MIEPPRDFARELQVWKLVSSHGDAIGFVDKNIRCLQHWITQKSVRRTVKLQLVAFFLICGHALQPGNQRHHREQEMQLGMLLDVRLPEDRRLLGVHPGGDVVHRQLTGVFCDLVRMFVERRERMPIGDEDKGFILLLESHPVAERAFQVAQMQHSRRLHAAYDPMLLRHAAPRLSPG